MKIVRDQTKDKREYKGHPCYAIDSSCPCRPCFNCHDCSPPNRIHSRQIYSNVFHCATNWNRGCPDPLPEPIHIPNRMRYCKKCQTKVTTQAGIGLMHTEASNNVVRNGAESGACS